MGDHARAPDEWHNRSVSGRNAFTAYVYRPMTPGFADYLIDHPTIPGPTLTAEVGDVLVVHFRNADRRLDQAVTMHPHGVKYNPEYDGAYMGEFTHARPASSRPVRRSRISGSARRNLSVCGRITTTGPTTR